MPLTARQKLENIEDAMIESIMEMTPDEVISEAIEEMGSREAIEAEVKRVTDVIRRAFPRPH